MTMLPKEREQYVLDNIGLVHHIIQTYIKVNPGNLDYQDYFQEGVVGLTIAAIRFDESREIKFSTFASHYIYGYIQRYKRENASVFYYPRKLQDAIYHVVKYTDQGFPPEKISEITGTPMADIVDAMTALSGNISLDALIDNANETSDATMESIIPDPSDQYTEWIDQEHLTDAIQAVTNHIQDEKWKGVWEEYIYNKLFGETLCQEYYAKKYGKSQSMISRKIREYKKMLANELSK